MFVPKKVYDLYCVHLMMKYKIVLGRRIKTNVT